MRSASLVCLDSAQKWHVGLQRRLAGALDPRCAGPLAGCSRRYFLIPRSAEVSASENAGRANSRSAYFMRGAACLGMAIP